MGKYARLGSGEGEVIGPAENSYMRESMLSGQTYIEPHWSELSGRILEGGYEIEDVLEAEQDRAKFKIRVLGDRSVDAFVLLLHAEQSAAERLLETWNLLRSLRHPNLSTPLSSGKTQLDGLYLIYAVLRKPEERLSEVLNERALKPEEAGEVLVSACAALEHLLSHGFVHGCLSPAEVGAVGNSIQLTTEGVRRTSIEPEIEITRAKYLAPESTAVNVTPAADVWCLGATLFQVLTGKDCAATCVEDAANLPAPFNRVAERCLATDPQSRCDLSEALTLYRSRAVGAAAATGSVFAVPELARIPEIKRTPENERAPEPAPVTASTPTASVPITEQLRIRARERDLASEKAPRPMRLWVYAVLAVIVLLVIIWAARPKRSTASAVTTSQVAQTKLPVPAGNAWETRTLSAESGAKPKPNAAPAAHVAAAPKPRTLARATEPATLNGPVWRVVLFTYNGRANADKSVQAINQKHPDLHAEVFSPNGQGAPYLVIAGGRMDHDAAARLRRKAISLGMPRDSYIQNYRE